MSFFLFFVLCNCVCVYVCFVYVCVCVFFFYFFFFVLCLVAFSSLNYSTTRLAFIKNIRMEHDSVKATMMDMALPGTKWLMMLTQFERADTHIKWSFVRSQLSYKQMRI
jgi:type III secretory pathway component EscU